MVLFTNWQQKMGSFLKALDPIDYEFPWTFDEMHKALPSQLYESGEPTQNRDNIWFFPKGMALPTRRGVSKSAHNGWLTVKKETLKEVPYPVGVPRGQDSLYNYRLIRAMKNWNLLPYPLAAYVRPR